MKEALSPLASVISPAALAVVIVSNSERMCSLALPEAVVLQVALGGAEAREPVCCVHNLLGVQLEGRTCLRWGLSGRGPGVDPSGHLLILVWP